MNVFFIADTHFGHSRIIEYEYRPFKDVNEMDQYIIEKWNKIVHKNDLIFVAGDFSFYSKDRTKEIVSQLKGRKYLIMGNHDRRRTVKWWRDVGFDEVSKYPLIFDGKFIISHEPVKMSKDMPYINLHGHLHSKQMEDERYLNLSVENWNYEPVAYKEIKKIYKDE